MATFKVLQYLHGNNGEPAAVTALSMKENGCLPEDTIYALRTTTLDQLPVDKLLKVYTEVTAPIVDTNPLDKIDWDTLFKGSRMYFSHKRLFMLKKMFVFITEPSDTDYTICVDNDVLCCSDLKQATPFKPGAYLAGRPYKRHRKVSLNTGFLIKGPGFDNGFDTELLPYLTNPYLFKKGFATCPYADEVAIAAYIRDKGLSRIHILEKKYNWAPIDFVRKRKSVKELGVVNLHWIGRCKPEHVNKPSLLTVNKLWYDMRDKLRRIINGD